VFEVLVIGRVDGHEAGVVEGWEGDVVVDGLDRGDGRVESGVEDRRRQQFEAGVGDGSDGGAGEAALWEGVEDLGFGDDAFDGEHRHGKDAEPVAGGRPVFAVVPEGGVDDGVGRSGAHVDEQRG